MSPNPEFPDPEMQRVDALLRAHDPAHADAGSAHWRDYVRTRLRRQRGAHRAGLVALALAPVLALVAGAASLGVVAGRAGVDEVPVITAPPGTAAVVPPRAGGNTADAAPVGETSDARLIAPGWGGSFIAGDGLDDAAGFAPGYRFTDAGIDRYALAADLARAFGVAGPVREEYDSLVVGPTDGTGPSIWVGSDSLVSWSYSAPWSDPCAVITPMPEPMPETTPKSMPEPMPAASAPVEEVPAVGGGSSPGYPGACAGADVAAVSAAEATRVARDLLRASGGRVQDWQWEATSDGSYASVTAWRLVADARTSVSFTVSFTGTDVQWASGSAANLEAVGDYPIVGAATAVTRSQQTRYGAFGPWADGGQVMPLAEPAIARDGATTSSDAAGDAAGDADSGAPSADGPPPVQLWWDPITITSAELTVATYTQPDGTTLVLPAYRLRTAQDATQEESAHSGPGEWIVIAVDDAAVQWTASS